MKKQKEEKFQTKQLDEAPAEEEVQSIAAVFFGEKDCTNLRSSASRSRSSSKSSAAGRATGTVRTR